MDEPQTTPESAPFDLKALLEDNSELKTSVEYKYGIVFELRYIPKSVLTQIARESTTYKYNPESKVREPELDSKKLIPKLCEKAVVGWEGMTPRSLSKIVKMNLSAVPKDKWDTPIPYSQKQLCDIAELAYGLDTFIQNTATDLAFFNQDTEQHESELKN